MLSKNKKNDFSKLWIKAYPVVSAFVSSLVSDYHNAEDVLGRVSTILIEKVDQYDNERSFEAWAIGIARYEVLKYYRERGRDRLRFSENLIHQISDQCSEMSEEMNAGKWALQQCLQEVTGRAAQALTLRYGENYRYKAIADCLGMKAGAVRVLLHRTRDVLRRCIEQRQEQGVGES